MFIIITGNSSVLSKPSGSSKRGGKTNTSKNNNTNWCEGFIIIECNSVFLSKPSGYSTRGSKTTNASKNNNTN